MMMWYFSFLIFLALFIQPVAAQQAAAPAFKVIPLGVYGGIDESNLSSYLVAPAGDERYVCLDAGTLHAGLNKAITAGTISGTATAFLRTNVKGYLISHPHLDHLAGMIINSPDDTTKAIYGLPFCLDVIADKYFSWKSWANFADKGEAPLLKKYHYMPLTGGQTTALENTGLSVQAFELSHATPGKSTAFLLSSGDAALLYLGDTGADTIEHATRLQTLWAAIAPLVQQGRLKAIFIETSYSNSQPEQSLFGHLTPKLLMLELQHLANLAGAAHLRDLPVVITHMKPSNTQETLIRKELAAANKLKLRLIFPRQAQPLLF